MRALRGRSLELLIFGSAFAARVGVSVHGGGLRGAYGYDSGVYYAAADALVHGRLPYRDYVLLHPPGIALVLSPFAWLGSFSGDDTGFLLGNLAFAVLGAVNAVLVVRIATRRGWGRGPAAIGGLCYAVWLGSLGAEYQARLEPLGNFFVLCGLLAWTYAAERPRNRWALWCGAAFGAAAAVKIWYVVPLAVLAGALLLHRDRRAELPRFGLGAAAALLAIDGPFFVLAPRQMWTMVVADQLGRQPATNLPGRLFGMTGMALLNARTSTSTELQIVAVVAVVFAAACLAASRVPNARLPVALLVAEVATLVLAPSWFTFYADYAAPGLALTTAAAACWLARTVHPRPVAAVSLAALAAAVVVPLAVAVALGVRAGSTRYPSAPLAEAVEHDRCVMADSPMALIELDVLSKDLSDGCPDWVDVTGRTYGIDATWLPDGREVPRAENRRWQHDLTGYLLSGQAVTLIRPAGTGVGSGLTRILHRDGVLARAGGYTVFRTRP